VNLFFEVQRKTLCVFASLRANFFFFSQSRKDLSAAADRRRDAKKLEKTSATYLKQAGFS
jgi:hypothetical protein